MNSKNLKTIKVIHMGLAAVAIILVFMCLIEDIMHPERGTSTALHILLDCCRIVALFCSSMYLAFGYKKNVAGFYQATGIAMAVSLLFRICLFIMGEMTALQGICSGISLACLLALALAKDLGKTKTMIIYALLLAAEVAMTIPMFSDLSMQNIAACLSTLIIVGSLGIMITGKYVDKESRGSK